jgi:hypothetical protein
MDGIAAKSRGFELSCGELTLWSNRAETLSVSTLEVGFDLK